MGRRVQLRGSPLKVTGRKASAATTLTFLGEAPARRRRARRWVSGRGRPRGSRVSVVFVPGLFWWPLVGSGRTGSPQTSRPVSAVPLPAGSVGTPRSPVPGVRCARRAAAGPLDRLRPVEAIGQRGDRSEWRIGQGAIGQRAAPSLDRDPTPGPRSEQTVTSSCTCSPRLPCRWPGVRRSSVPWTCLVHAAPRPRCQRQRLRVRVVSVPTPTRGASAWAVVSVATPRWRLGWWRWSRGVLSIRGRCLGRGCWVSGCCRRD